MIYRHLPRDSVEALLTAHYSVEALLTALCSVEASLTALCSDKMIYVLFRNVQWSIHDCVSSRCLITYSYTVTAHRVFLSFVALKVFFLSLGKYFSFTRIIVLCRYNLAMMLQCTHCSDESSAFGTNCALSDQTFKQLRNPCVPLKHGLYGAVGVSE